MRKRAPLGTAVCGAVWRPAARPGMTKTRKQMGEAIRGVLTGLGAYGATAAGGPAAEGQPAVWE